MHKVTKYLLAAVGSISAATIILSGCGNKQTSNIDLRGVPKQDYHNQLVLEELSCYKSNDNMLPTDEEKKKLEKKAAKNVVKISKLYKQEQKEKIKIDKKTLDSYTEETLFEQLYGINKSDYKKILKTNHTNDKSFRHYNRKYTQTYVEMEQLQEIYQKRALKHPKLFLGKTAGTINGKKVSYEKYYFYFIQDAIYRQLTNKSGSPVKEEIMSSIVSDQNVVNYCKENKIKVTQSDIQEELDIQKKTIQTIYKTDQALESYVNTYGFSLDRFSKDLEKYAKVCAYNTKLEKVLQKQISPKYSDVVSYYKKHYATNDRTIVFVDHALFNHKKDAEDFYNQHKDITTKEDFKAAVKQYKKEHPGAIALTEDLTNIQRGELTGKFGDIIFSAEPNKVFKPSKGEYGYHVGIVYQREEDVKTSVKNDYDHLRKQTKQSLGTRKYNVIRHERDGIDISINNVKTILETFAKV